jgi:hypothetical protein
MNSPIPALRKNADRLCNKLAEQENESPDALWEFFTSCTGNNVPLKYKKASGEYDPAAKELWDAIYELKLAEMTEIKHLLPA